MNRTRASSLDAFGTRNQRNRIYPALEASDGSTLSLDFTQMSSLDSRFTFTRSTTATYINSQGLVKYADHNLFTNTAWLGSTLPTNWNLLIGTGTITWNANGSVTMTAATSQRPAINHSTITTINPGVPHTFGYLATGVSGSPQISQIINSNIVGETYAINGVTVASSTVVQSNDVVSCTFTPTTTNVTARIGPGSTGPQSDMSVTASRPQFNVGSSLQPYAANTSTAATYQAPRFDYNPTTLTPRGLLIEGSVTNLSRSSADLTNATYWTLQTAYTATSNSAGPSPDGTNNASSFTEPSTNLQRSIYQLYTGSAAGTYTGSMWAKLSSGSTRYIRLVVSSSSGNFGYVTVNISTGAVQQSAAVVGTATNASATVTAYPAGWYRITLTVTLAASIDFMFAVPMDVTSIDTPTTNYGRVSYLGDGSVFLLWGAQLETGSGASSHIPTGTSTVQRTGESCTMTGTNFSSWYGSPTASSVLFEGIIQQAADGFRRILLLTSSSSPNTGVPNYNVGVAGGFSNRPFINAHVNAANNVDEYVPSSAAVTNGTKFRLAVRAQSGSYRISRAGQSATSTYSTAPGYPAGLITFGFIANGVYMTSQWISRLIYYPFGISNSQMDEWSA